MKSFVIFLVLAILATAARASYSESNQFNIDTYPMKRYNTTVNDREELRPCNNNFDCVDPVIEGCCGGFCRNYQLYADVCNNTQNRPLYAYCEYTDQCGDQCCGYDQDECVPPLLDCKGQLPLWAFNAIMGGIFIALAVIYYVVDWLEKKRRKERFEKYR